MAISTIKVCDADLPGSRKRLRGLFHSLAGNAEFGDYGVTEAEAELHRLAGRLPPSFPVAPNNSADTPIVAASAREQEGKQP
ncbi:hypothetical protein NK553_20325 [Pseudomonas sp. ZM23]|uniref:Uncharacterized protein n=1 Tax=Pseudomonas triclosanedens TaxID=2961893 RepID=A0ABY7A4W5_9PSED|nr:hypothetical protein [Pseudomonas triclosanedens]MCP8466304.1 hypothetical protein [Pseudomonas triclosanedens]MCP8471830.1 hypothetical protein [Pseudomonas triclosanedens]MCP8478525.1 hypothetical protein [Pseudomonas triclosanedens]WAI52279.1 hypothetical protein OU419_13825 [Pseudomonas triclosanedens]